eukprot:scaffold22083_cov54-Phaeocystis_antarctica.AAC.2
MALIGRLRILLFRVTPLELTQLSCNEFRLFPLLNSSLFETKERTCKQGTVQLARTRDPPRTKRAYTELRTVIEHRTQLIILRRVRRVLAVPVFHWSSTTMGGPFHGKTRQQPDASRRLVARAFHRRSLIARLAASFFRSSLLLMPPSATAGEPPAVRCTAGGYRATGGDAPGVLRAPVVISGRSCTPGGFSFPIMKGSWAKWALWGSPSSRDRDPG